MKPACLLNNKPLEKGVLINNHFAPMLTKRKSLFVIVIMLLPVMVIAQQSVRAYEFLGLPVTARVTALGGYPAPDLDPDLGAALFYPSLLRSEVSNHLSLNFVDYFGDINYGTVAFARTFEKPGTFSASLQYIDYGVFTQADETGQTYGQFGAGEYSFMLGWARPLNDRFSIGSNLKLIYSSLEEYYSWGVAADVAVSYTNPGRLLAMGLVARNIGRQVVHYRENNSENLPFDLVIGISKKLANAPLRFTFAAHNLHRFDLTYVSPIQLPGQSYWGEEDNTQTASERVGDFSDKVMRHMVLGMEFIPGKNFAFRFGYNYRRRQEMKIDTRMSTVGFSWGFGVKISRFELNYGRSNYHLAGAPNHISISTSFSDLFNPGGSVPSLPDQNAN